MHIAVEDRMLLGMQDFAQISHKSNQFCLKKIARATLTTCYPILKQKRSNLLKSLFQDHLRLKRDVLDSQGSTEITKIGY